MSKILVSFSPLFQAQLENELRRHECRLEERLAPGVGLVHCKHPFPALAERWFRRPPVYLHRLSPVQLSVPVGQLRREFRSLLPRLRSDVPFCVQVLPLDGLAPEAHWELESWCERVAVSVRHAPRDVRRPGQVVSVVLAGGRAWVGSRAGSLDAVGPPVPTGRRTGESGGAQAAGGLCRLWPAFAAGGSLP